MLFKVQKKLFCFDKKLVRRNTLTFKINSHVCGNFKGIWGNPGEIPHAGFRVCGVKGLSKDVASAISIDLNS